MEVVFEAATIFDLAKKANTIAPVKGVEAGRAAGTLLEIRPNQNPSVTVKSTNTLVYYLEWSNALSCSGTEDVDWRLPSALLAAVLGSFPLDASSTVTFTNDPYSPGILEIKHLKSVIKLRMMDAHLFPSFQPFDPTGLQEAKDFADKFNQVAWAAHTDKTQGAKAGVHVDGTHLRATDNHRLASVPCAVPISEPVTLPPEVMAPLLKNTKDVQVAVANGKFYMMPDELTQITSVTIDGAFPDMSMLLRVLPQTISLNVPHLKATIDRMMLLVGGSERFPRLEMTIGDETMKLRILSNEVGSATDELDLPGQALHDPWTINFLPKILLSALTSAPGDIVSFSYDPDARRTLPYIQGGQGYEAWVAPRTEAQPGS